MTDLLHPADVVLARLEGADQLTPAETAAVRAVVAALLSSGLVTDASDIEIERGGDPPPDEAAA